MEDRAASVSACPRQWGDVVALYRLTPVRPGDAGADKRTTEAERRALACPSPILKRPSASRISGE